MEKKLLSSVHDFDDMLHEHHEMNYANYSSDYCVKNNPPTSYPCVICFEFQPNNDSADEYSWEYVYPSDFELT